MDTIRKIGEWIAAHPDILIPVVVLACIFIVWPKKKGK